nr:hypothetical protein [Saccharibacillus alkalitolerans]
MQHAVELLFLLPQQLRLMLERAPQLAFVGFQFLRDPLQRIVQKLERQYLLQPDQVAVRVQAMPLIVIAGRLQQPFLMVKTQRAFGNARQLGKSAYRIGSVVDCPCPPSLNGFSIGVDVASCASGDFELMGISARFRLKDNVSSFCNPSGINQGGASRP